MASFIQTAGILTFDRQENWLRRLTILVQIPQNLWKKCVFLFSKKTFIQ